MKYRILFDGFKYKIQELCFYLFWLDLSCHENNYLNESMTTVLHFDTIDEAEQYIVSLANNKRKIEEPKWKVVKEVIS